MKFGIPHRDPSAAKRGRTTYGIGLILLGLLLAVPAQQASALALKADATLIPDPTGGQISGEVTFDLPQRVRIGDTTFKICQTDKTLCGRTHTCTLNPQISTDPRANGNIKLLLRASRGTKIGGVFVGAVTAGAGWLLLEAGCDGDPSTLDAFQGDLASIFAEVAIIGSQALTSNHGHPDGITIKEELKNRFQIGACRDNVEFKILDFHGYQVNNRGGSATGLASAKVKLIFRKSC
jgi:hypothetical protein